MRAALLPLCGLWHCPGEPAADGGDCCIMAGLDPVRMCDGVGTDVGVWQQLYCFFPFKFQKVYLPFLRMEDWNYSRTVFGSPNCSFVEFFHPGLVSKAKSVGDPLVWVFPTRHCSVLKLILMEFVALWVNFGILSADWLWRLDLVAGVVLVGFHLIHIHPIIKKVIPWNKFSKSRYVIGYFFSVRTYF